MPNIIYTRSERAKQAHSLLDMQSNVAHAQPGLLNCNWKWSLNAYSNRAHSTLTCSALIIRNPTDLLWSSSQASRSSRKKTYVSSSLSLCALSQLKVGLNMFCNSAIWRKIKKKVYKPVHSVSITTYKQILYLDLNQVAHNRRMAS